MIRVIVDAVNPVGQLAASHIHLAANDRLDTCGLGSLIKVNTAVHHAVIGEGHRILTKLLDPVHHTADPAGTVQEAVFTVNMQMYKTHCCASCAISTSFFSR